MFAIKPKIKIVGTILARDEEDIIGTNIEHHINQGVTHFIITNNNSKDKTKQIAEKYPEVVEIIDEHEKDHNQSKWVTRMARLACKLNPDWIVHFDSDELWCGLTSLKTLNEKYVSSPRMFLHPPCGNKFDLNEMRFYLDFETYGGLPGECKVLHRPDPNIEIQHGNHGFTGIKQVYFTKNIWRHHYPVRSYEQFKRKAINGHNALLSRNAVCERWRKWHDLYNFGLLQELYKTICDSWESIKNKPNKEDLLKLIEFWCTPEVIKYIASENKLPKIEEWPNQF
jgi:glycosyltransferase involved in cell wall biosynthesis